MRAGRPPKLADPADAEAAYGLALRKLAHQPLPRALLEDRLRRAGYQDAAVKAAADRAAAQGYLNDHEYARSLVRRRSQVRGQALIAQELRAKGVDEAAAAEALGGIDAQAEEQRALALARPLIEAPPANHRQILLRIGPKLSRRGFSTGVIHRVARELFAEWAGAGRFDTSSEHN